MRRYADRVLMVNTVIVDSVDLCQAGHCARPNVVNTGMPDRVLRDCERITGKTAG